MGALWREGGGDVAGVGGGFKQVLALDLGLYSCKCKALDRKSFFRSLGISSLLKVQNRVHIDRPTN